ncbi:hypothetical protein AVKW3434_08750 [Acidovorax sp. SUPP3434]|uniref:hypothetical protein n=1 Tax=Acidovorax sp. SUPP3434 TaxID=2920880 RepID=UPI0023DE37DC|nr:hypothetical protein [Acidovorax sp. SUPP3434]GKS99460.1 hypothetical protein AVKW3434_08750 [Acidovorax sp. SUPP3434]
MNIPDAVERHGVSEGGKPALSRLDEAVPGNRPGRDAPAGANQGARFDMAELAEFPEIPEISGLFKGWIAPAFSARY